MAATKAVELIVSGRVQRVGYRDFVTDVGRALKIVGFAENLKDGTVRIRCKGEASTVEKFKTLINVKNPSETPLIEVENITEKPLKEAEITEAVFEEKYGDPNVELLQAVSTGTKYIGHLSRKIDDLSAETKAFKAESNANFQGLGNKIDSGFGKMDVNFGVLADKYGKISTTMERIDKNIEKISTKKKGIF